MVRQLKGKEQPLTKKQREQNAKRAMATSEFFAKYRIVLMVGLSVIAFIVVYLLVFPP